MIRSKHILRCSLLLAAISAVSAGTAEEIDFNRDIRPLISSNCIACHGPDENERAADLRLDTAEGSRADLGGYAAIVPGDADASEMIYRIITDDEADKMPPKGKGRRFTPDEIALLKRWVEQGGDYAKHWSYEKPRLAKIPANSEATWPVVNPIDSFIQERLRKEGLQPSAQADRWTLARRVALDLTGLPPSWDEASGFVNDSRADAYERYVDRQLAKPAFGERWARVWLDLARYADSAGYADDPPRTIWAFRDWVITALNSNMPFDQFTIEQIAGDLLESPTEDQLIATAFHRNTLTNNEGGTNNEEFRNAAVVDRVNTTMEVWMGTTMACAQCHTHKYDPITHHEYFQMFDFFNQSEDSDQRDERPFLELWSDGQLKQKQDWEAQVSHLQKILSTDTPELRSARETWLERVRREPAWNPLKLGAADGAALIEKDRWLTLNGKPKEKASYTLSFPTSKGRISGLRLEVAPEQESNFVLGQLSATWKPSGNQGIDGQFVRIEVPGKSKFIHLAELQVFSGGKNIALTGKASQKSTGYNGPAKLAIDGNTDGDYKKGSVSHTAPGNDPWFEIDLGTPQSLDSIVLWNRTDGGTAERIKGYKVQILDSARKVVWEESPSDIPEPSHEVATSGARTLNFKAAFADYSQKGFAASQVIAAKPADDKGWAVGGQTGKAHELSLILSNPVELDEGTLEVTLSQTSKYANHLLTHFRIATTDDPNASEWARMPANIRAMVRKTEPSSAEADKVAAFHRSITSLLARERRELAGLQSKLKDAEPHTTVPVMKDLTGDKYRATNVQIRGNYKTLGDEVKMATPSAFHPMRENQPKNRLGLAQWLVDSENPLTARVIANRFWSQIFGRGIVVTSEEFGSQGELPSHPELLDWLAIQFAETWDIKALIKTLVMSSTYRQNSRVTSELEEADPFNLLYARGPRFRISAEMVRDQALFLSGLISDKMYGPPVKPPQPELGLKAAFGSATDWQTSQGEDKYRRGLYTTWRRSSPYPSMAAFDAPNREVCTSRRGRTNTPLQALVTMNDPVYVEAAQAMARQLYASADTTRERAELGLVRSLLRPPTDQEIDRLESLFETSLEQFRGSPEMAEQLATNPLGPLPDQYPPA
ncbi:MAG: DUF1553 domain-containing protein, partial [Verrucomicrobiota bacterium]